MHTQLELFPLSAVTGGTAPKPRLIPANDDQADTAPVQAEQLPFDEWNEEQAA